MESVIVNARVPKAKKDAAMGILQRKGLTVTDLINGAVDFLIETEEVPAGKTQAKEQRDMAQFRSFVKRSTLEVPWPEDDTRSYKELIIEGRRADYEALGSDETTALC